MKVRIQISDGDKGIYILPNIENEINFYEKIKINENTQGVKALRINEVFELEYKQYKVTDIAVILHSELKSANIKEEIILNIEVVAL